MNILKHVIDQKIHAKIKFFNVKRILKDQNLQQSCHLKLLAIKNIYIRKLSMHFSLIIFSFDDVLFFNFYFDITLTYFLNPHFSFFLCDKHSVVISKVHYKSIIFLAFIQKIYDDSH
jgi:hypothetical protein